MTTLEQKIQEHAEQRRPALTVEVRKFLPHAGIDGSVIIREVNSADELDATEAAVTRRRKTLTALPKEYVAEFLSDPKFLADVQNVETLWRATRDAADPTKPAFTSAEVMHKVMTTYELQTLWAYYERARLLAAPEAGTPSRESVHRLAATVGEPASMETAIDALMALPRSVVVEMFVILAQSWLAFQHADPAPQGSDPG